jgi:hypothetical protein
MEVLVKLRFSPVKLTFCTVKFAIIKTILEFLYR